MFVLITATEVEFLLPFGITRVFRPTLLDVFAINNFELGVAQSVYGVVAMISYFAGGPLADRFSARRLMATAMVTTACGGVAMAIVDSLWALELLYGFWGVTTILLFWAAVIRATREWGGASEQGRAFGILEGGRGLVAAMMATGLVVLLSSLLPVDAGSASLAERSAALRTVIVVVTLVTFLTAGLVALLVPDEPQGEEGKGEEKQGRGSRRRLDLRGLLLALRNPAVWLQALIITCAYVGYKSVDNVALFARDAFGYDDVEAASLSTLTFWVRPVAALGAGLLADRIAASKVVMLAFVAMIIGNVGLALGLLPLGVVWVLAMTLVVACLGTFALRGVYFALFDEAGVPLAYTGSAVGLISFVGYTPDVFFGPLMGYLTVSSPGALGHHRLYAMVAGFGLLGLLASLGFRRRTRGPASRDPSLGG